VDAADLVHALRELLQDSAQRQAMHQAGLAFSRQHAGATARLMDLIAEYIR
jgi:3-deoxy-D-manno-octulosonic-acid transferase